MVSQGVRFVSYVLLGVICGTLIVGSTLNFEIYSSLPPVKEGDFGSLQRFKTVSELNTFLEKHTSRQIYYALESAAKSMTQAGGADYSGTNIQVAGVDEADMVKTNGKYIYLSKGNAIYIALAYPAENAKLISKISLDEQVGDLYISGDKLVVFSRSVATYPVEPMPKIPGILPPTPAADTTNIRVYDVSDRAKPALDREFKAEGAYLASRMIGDYVYVVVQKGARLIEGKTQPPMIQEGKKAYQIQPTEILYYSNATEPWYSYTTILSFNTQFPDKPKASETFLLGASSTIYVSPSYLYLTNSNWSNTTIHKIRLYEGAITAVAEATVPGFVLNQFSMDEYDGYFRIATSSGNRWWGWRRAVGDTTSAVYVLDQKMKVVGKLEGLAPKEDIYSARFTGSRCYLVTFKKVDPLFVIDLSKPTKPAVLGKLKIPGYSNYLHPYDENHIIGLGKETVEAEQGDFAWYQGVKISLFDVTDVANPKEDAKIEIGDRGTDSPALSDHHAFLFSKEKNLLAIPILEAKINPNQYKGTPPANAYGEFVYQGAYVFSISTSGISLRGRITHIQDDSLLKSGYYYDSAYMVERSLYIGDYLYTISGGMIKVNTLSTLKEINSIILK